MKYGLYLITAGLFVITSANECKKIGPPKTDNGLPLATQAGHNIFACKVNGVNWIAKNSIYNRGGGIKNDTLEVWGSNPATTNFYELFNIRINNYINNISTYLLSDTANRYAQFSTNNNCITVTGGFGIGRGKAFQGELKLSKVDVSDKIISGTFWFNIKTDFCDTLKITDGRFDIKYY
jgi:hypothetical protein